MGPERTLPACVVFIALSGCRTAELSAGAALVRVSQSAPADLGADPARCRSLGYIVGRGGSTQ